MQACVDAGTYYWLFNMPVALAFTGESLALPIHHHSITNDILECGP